MEHSPEGKKPKKQSKKHDWVLKKDEVCTGIAPRPIDSVMEVRVQVLSSYYI
jgi:hypothetical protein